MEERGICLLEVLREAQRMGREELMLRYPALIC